MEMMMKRLIILGLILGMLLNGCTIFGVFAIAPDSVQDAGEVAIPDVEKSEDGDNPDEEKKYSEPINADTLESTEDKSDKDAQENINPLTGLPTKDADNLKLPPALVSVTNFPPTARPQAGLTFSPIVFELFIGDGMTRYLAIFYGDYPTGEVESGELEAELTEGLEAPAPAIGPVRSGRIPYEYVRKLFNGFIVMASAYSTVAEQLGDHVNVFGDDQSDINSAMIGVDDIAKIAQETSKELGGGVLDAMHFDAQAPEGGKDAHSLWIYYAYKNQVFWRYNEDGTYHRWQDDADGTTFIEQTDRLNDEPLAYENVIVLFADHTVEQKYIIDIDLLFVKRGKALVFRDGKMHEVYWTTKSEEYEQTTGKLRPIRFIDAEGNPFPLKPGQTWIELMPTHSPYWETVDSDKYHVRVSGNSKGSGHWGVYFKIDY